MQGAISLIARCQLPTCTRAGTVSKEVAHNDDFSESIRSEWHPKTGFFFDAKKKMTRYQPANPRMGMCGGDEIGGRKFLIR